MVTNTKTSENNNTDNALSQESLTQFYKTVREFCDDAEHTLEKCSNEYMKDLPICNIC